MLLLTASSRFCWLHVEGGHQSREPQHTTEVTRHAGPDCSGHQGRVTAASLIGIPSPTHITLGLEGYWCRRAAKSWVLGMKTLWVSRKSLRNVSVGQGWGWEGISAQVIARLYVHPEYTSPKSAQVKEAVPSPCDSSLHPSEEHFLPTAGMDQSRTC